MGDVNPQESERTPLKPREIAYAITRGNSLYNSEITAVQKENSMFFY